MIPLGVLASAYVAPAGGGGLTFAYVGTEGTNSTAHTFTATAANLGTPASDRNIILGFGGYINAPGNYITGITIGGVSATLDLGASDDGGAFAGFAHAHVPTGATGDVVISWYSLDFAIRPTRQAFGLWTVYGSDTLTVEDTATGTASGTVDASSGASFAVQYGGVYTSGLSWTNATPRFNLNIGGSGRFLAGADSAATGSLAISTNYASTYPAFAAISYGAA